MGAFSFSHKIGMEVDKVRGGILRVRGREADGIDVAGSMVSGCTGMNVGRDGFEDEVRVAVGDVGSG